MIKILLVIVGGALGALSRYGVSILSVKLFGHQFPWGTLMVNLAGCFFIGLTFSIGLERNILSPHVRLFFMTGFLGALTTFSTFALETINFTRDDMFLVSMISFLANNLLGLILVLFGIWVGKVL